MVEKRRKHLTPLFFSFIVWGGVGGEQETEWERELFCLARWHHLAKLGLSLRTKQGQVWLLFGLEIPELYTRLGILNIQEEGSGKPFLYCSQENHLDVSIKSSLAKRRQAKVKLDLVFCLWAFQESFSRLPSLTSWEYLKSLGKVGAFIGKNLQVLWGD